MRLLTNAIALQRLGGVELNTLELGSELAARGHATTVVYRQDGEMRQEYTAAGIDVHGPASFRFDPVSAPVDLARMLPSVAWAARQDVDVVWLQRFEHSVWGHLVAAAGRSPLVCHLHQAPESSRVSLLGRGTTSFVAVSEFMRRSWIAAGLPADRVHTIHNSVPDADYPTATAADRAAARRELGLPDDVFVALLYGRMSADKGVGTALSAWEATGLGADEARLLLVGDEDGVDPALRSQARRLGADGRCSWLPRRDDVSTVLHACDVVLFPSHLPEAFGRVVLEALTAGRPVLASDVGGVPEILTGELRRFLLPPGDVEAWSTAVKSIVTEGPGFTPADLAARARENFPHEHLVGRLEELLGDAARGRRRARGSLAASTRRRRGPGPAVPAENPQRRTEATEPVTRRGASGPAAPVRGHLLP